MTLAYVPLNSRRMLQGKVAVQKEILLCQNGFSRPENYTSWPDNQAFDARLGGHRHQVQATSAANAV